MNIALLVATAIFTLAFGYYAITAFQWFSYKASRVLFHFTKPLWHVCYALLPSGVFVVLQICLDEKNATLFTALTATLATLSLLYTLALFFWWKKLDKPLVFTNRVKRFFLFVVLVFLLAVLCKTPLIFVPFLTLFDALALSYFCEKFIAFSYKKKARQKLQNLPNLKVILITASYGKTSMKNFIFDILREKFICYKTPRSVNTTAGIVRDINENLATNTQFYIVEAGARAKGDIREICELVSPHFVVVGQIGDAHLEYFKSLENTRATKLEALESPRLQQAFLHSSTLRETSEKVIIYDKFLTHKEANLKGLKFGVLVGENECEFNAKLLGGFNAENLTAAVLLGFALGLNAEELASGVGRVKSVEHRLELLNAGGKLIIDDSFNGNFEGMSASYELVREHSGRKILLTPGIVEAGSEPNERLSRLIDEIFDVVVITSALNKEALERHLQKPKVVFLPQKEKMKEWLVENTSSGDLVLFSNDAPSFV